MSVETTGVGVVRVKDTSGEVVGLLAFPKSATASGLDISNAVLLTGSDAEVGAAIRNFFAEPDQEG